MNYSEDSETLVTVYTSGNNAICALVKSMLDEAGITYLAKGDNLQSAYPINAFPVEFQVLTSDVEFARELLKDVEESIEIDSPDDGESEDEYEED